MGIPDDIKVIFKEIKSDLKTLYDILEEKPQYKIFIKDDIANVQRMTSNTLSKLKKSISINRAIGSHIGLLDEVKDQRESAGDNT